MKNNMKKKMKVVLAYSGGLDTSIMVRWLIEKYDCEVIGFCADLGQGLGKAEDLGAIKAKALKTGASKCYVADLKEEFVSEYVFPMLRGNAIYEGTYLLGTSIARPLIAKKQIEIAKKEKAQAVAHGATGKGNDQVRFELTYYAHQPDIKVIAPWKTWEFKSRTDLIQYAEKHKIPVPASKSKPYSSDVNLFHISYEGGILEDPWAEPPEEIFQITKSPENAPNKPRYLDITYEKGNPVALDGKKLSPAKLLDQLNHIAGDHGVGREDIVENRYVGMKSRGVYETPGGTVLQKAHRALETITMDREVMHLRDSLIPRYAEMIYYGYWFAPEREMLQTMIDQSQEFVTGVVRVKLYKGSCHIVGRKSPYSLFSEAYATFETDTVYNQQDAEGFIRLNALRLKLRKLTQK